MNKLQVRMIQVDFIKPAGSRRMIDMTMRQNDKQRFVRQGFSIFTDVAEAVAGIQQAPGPSPRLPRRWVP